MHSRKYNHINNNNVQDSKSQIGIKQMTDLLDIDPYNV